MNNIALTLAYDGTSFFGWQRCNSGPSVEQTLKKYLEIILQHPITLQAASRTDRGVHAKGQVINFFTEKQIDLGQLKYSLNSLLPPSIAILEIQKKPTPFHPTLDVTGKEYIYTICNSEVQLPEHRLFSWHIPKPLNINQIKNNAKLLIGKRDFAPYTNTRADAPYASTIRTLYSVEITPLATKRLQISLIADHFLYKMARNLVGKIVNKTICAPAHGLTLNRVFYSDILSAHDRTQRPMLLRQRQEVEEMSLP